MLSVLLLAACALAPVAGSADEKPSQEAIEARIAHYAKAYGIPFALLRKVVKSESTFDPGARNGPYWGLMQIRHDTAKGLGYSGPPSGLLDAETNLVYGGAYLANAYIIAGGNSQQAHNLYRKGYYYEAKRKGLLAKLIKVPMGMTPVMVAGKTVARPAGAKPESTGVMLAANDAPEPIVTAAAPEPAAAPMVKPVARPVLARAAVAEPLVVAKAEIAADADLPLLPRRRPAAPSRLTALVDAEKGVPRGLLYAVPLKAPIRLARAAEPTEMLARPELALAETTSGFASRATAAALAPASQRSVAARLPTAVRLAASHDGTLSEIPACCQLPSASGDVLPLPRSRPAGSRID
ncbi:MAG: hypothetical protein ABS35_25820 [Kaistia sp. SCN 65-12]|nr:MAG: hypothetical protein ABS35_25820 [Kaistia sp. SCN 65-12]